MSTEIVVLELERGQAVQCFVCREAKYFQMYTRGEAVLAGPDHYPYNAEANYICNAHVSSTAIRRDPFEGDK